MSIFKRLLGRNNQSTVPDDLDFSQVLSESLEELRVKNEALKRTWQIETAEQWQVDLDRGILRWTLDNGVIAQAPAQLVGSVRTDDDTWIWAWANPKVNPVVAVDSHKVRQWGDERGVLRMTTEEWGDASEYAREMMALSVKICEASGVFVWVADSWHLYLNLGEPHVLAGLSPNDPFLVAEA